MQQKATRCKQFGVQNSSTGGTADGIVAQDNETDIKNRTRPEAPDADGHTCAAMNIAAQV